MSAERFSFKLRPAVKADYDVIAAIWHSSASLENVGPPVMPSLDAMRERVDAEMAADWNVTLALRDQDILGFVAIKPNEAILDQLFIRPDALGLGAG